MTIYIIASEKSGAVGSSNLVSPLSSLPNTSSETLPSLERHPTISARDAKIVQRLEELLGKIQHNARPAAENGGLYDSEYP